jgi:ribonuclease HII
MPVAESLAAYDDRLRRERGIALLAGIDEAGRGPLAGPVVAAVVVLGPGARLPGVNDSKQLKPAAREAMIPAILGHARAFGLGLATAAEIDRINVLQATHLAAARALTMLADPPARHGLNGGGSADALTRHSFNEGASADLSAEASAKAEALARAEAPANADPPPGPLAAARPSALPEFIITDYLNLKDTPAPLLAIKKGDATSLAVAAASVLAKVARDRIMQLLDAEYPLYGFARHKGYGTRQHLAALREHGPSTAHRLTFAGVCGPVEGATVHARSAAAAAAITRRSNRNGDTTDGASAPGDASSQNGASFAAGAFSTLEPNESGSAPPPPLIPWTDLLNGASATLCPLPFLPESRDE